MKTSLPSQRTASFDLPMSKSTHETSVTRRTALKKLAVSSSLAAAAVTSITGCRYNSETEIELPTELIIQGGRVVAESIDEETDVRIVDGKVQEIGKALVPSRELTRTIDAKNRLVLPGAIDPHVHLDKPWDDDFRSGSKAAVSGGITTVGHMCFQLRREPLFTTLKRTRDRVKEQSLVDFLLHPVITEPALVDVDALDQLASKGFFSVKYFMENERYAKNLVRVSDLMRRGSRLGVLSMIHAEDNQTIADAVDRLVNAGRTGIRYFPASRPVEAEVIAVQNAIEMASETGSAIYFVHLSSREALEKCRAAQSAGLPVFVETRPTYLHLTDSVYSRIDNGLFVCMPPIRAQEDQDALWNGLHDGSIQTIASDHAAWEKLAKTDPSASIESPKGGVNNLQVMLPMLMDLGVGQKRISIQEFVKLTSTNAAKLFGIYPEKGDIRVGGDGDLVIWNQERTRIIDGSTGFSNAGYSIYDGQSIKGWPETTIRRGVVVYEDANIASQPGTGKLLKQKPNIRKTFKLS